MPTKNTNETVMSQNQKVLLQFFFLNLKINYEYLCALFLSHIVYYSIQYYLNLDPGYPLFV